MKVIEVGDLQRAHDNDGSLPEAGLVIEATRDELTALPWVFGESVAVMPAARAAELDTLEKAVRGVLANCYKFGCATCCHENECYSKPVFDALKRLDELKGGDQ